MNSQDLALFVRTADCGSITRAAAQLGLTSATASASLKRLERQLEVSLFIRTTRQLRITAEGERFLIYARQVLNSLEAGKASIHALQGKVTGQLRISVPSDLGRNLLLGWFDEIMQAHPSLSIHLLLGDSIADFYLDRVDLAIRYANQEDSSLVAFKLSKVERVVCASPDYLAMHALPETPEDLLKHNCLLMQLNDRNADLWSFIKECEKRDESIKVRVRSNRCANDGDVVRRWAIAGRGIAYKSKLDVADDFRSGSLIHLLKQYRTPAIDLNLVCPSRGQVTPAVLLLRDILRQKFSQHLDVTSDI